MNMIWPFNSSCEQRQNVSLLASGGLSEEAQTTAREHTANCVECRQHYDEIICLTAKLERWAETVPPVEASPALRARWMQSIQSADRPRPEPNPISRWTDCFWPSPTAWAALAMIWLGLLLLKWTTPDQRRPDQIAARTPSTHVEVTLAQRQRELSSLLESLASPPATARPELPRTRSQRRVECVTV